MGEAIRRRGIKELHSVWIDCITAEHVVLDSGKKLDYDLVIWATGARAHEAAKGFQENGIETTKRDWVAVNSCMQSVSAPAVFAAGDCSHVTTADPVPPKA